MSASDIRSRLNDAINDYFRGKDSWGYYVDHFGDSAAGDVVYSSGSQMCRASYTITSAEGSSACSINFDAKVDVVPRTTYEVETPASEAAAADTTGKLSLVEGAGILEPIILREAKADYEIKLIAPGKGSSAFYPAEVLKRDGPKVFKAGTHVYLNHPTAAEEAARPEGDVSKLVGVLSTGAVYHEAHAKGPGLYGRMKVFADHATLVEEKAAHVGMSIRASGIAESNKIREGVPVLKEFTSAESVDVVTRAGAGGLILPLTEAAVPPTPTNTQEDSDMDAAEFKQLQESNKRLLERAIRSDAREMATRVLAGISLSETSRARVVETIMSRELPITEGALDETKFTEAVNAEAKREGQYVASLVGSGRVLNMGGGAPSREPVELTEAEKAAQAKKLRETTIRSYITMGMPKDAAILAADKDTEEAA